MRQRSTTSTYPLPGVFAPVLSLDALVAASEAAGGPQFDIRDESPCAEELLERDQAHRAVTSFVDALNPRDREIVKRLFWQDETQTEIAYSFGVSKMAISKALARIARHGRRALGDYKHLTLSN